VNKRTSASVIVSPTAVGVEIEGARPLVVHRTAYGHRRHRLEAEQPPHDDGPARARARAAHHQFLPGDDPNAVVVDERAGGH